MRTNSSGSQPGFLFWLVSLQSEIKPPISPPYVGCIISDISSTSGCVENTAWPETRSTNTRYLAWQCEKNQFTKVNVQNVKSDNIGKKKMTGLLTNPPLPWHSDVERHVPWKYWVEILLWVEIWFGWKSALGGNLLQPQIDYDFQIMSPNIAPVVVDAVHSSFGK